MKLFKNLFLFLSVVICSQNYAQQNPATVEELPQKYSDYFQLNRESVFLHLNKTKVFPGENIWFSAYAYSPQFMLPNLTTNLHVNLYNSEGNLMEAKTVYIENGQGAGYFKLDQKKHPSGQYIIKAFTRYMDNFPEDRSFSQTFTVLGETNQKPVLRKFDLQILPEGGHLIANVVNSVGVKLIDNSGEGVYFTGGRVLNSRGEVVNTFQSNRFGLSQFRFIPKTDEDYTVVLIAENEHEIKKKIPIPEPRGIALSTNILGDMVHFSIKTNPATFNNLESNKFILAYHKAGAMKAFHFSIPEDKLEANINISKKALFPGVNTITVFNNKMEPLVERLIFNRKGISRKQVRASFLKRELDSLIINLWTPDSIGMHSLSISVLPEGTEAYNPDHNILSAFYLKPYIKGKLENGAYYFSNNVEARRRNYDMNLLLLTQGWSRYSWQNIFNKTPKERFPPEVGFTIQGKVLKRNEKRENKLFIQTENKIVSALAPIQKDGSFVLENTFLQDSVNISFGLMNNRNNTVSKPVMNFNVLPAKDTENTEVPKFMGVELTLHPMTENGLSNEERIPPNFIKGSEELKAVLIEGNAQEEEDIRNPFSFRTIAIDEKLARSFPLVLDLIRFKGFQIIRGGGGGVEIINRRKKGLGIYKPAPKHPALVIDGLRRKKSVPGGSVPNYSLLNNLRTDAIKSIYINKNGAQFGPWASAGIIKIETKKSYDYKGTPEKTTFTVIAKNGFATSKEFYTPKYRSYTNELFEHYGTISWFPSITLEDGKTQIKILNTLQPEVKLFIEGMTETGALISEMISVETN